MSVAEKIARRAERRHVRVLVLLGMTVCDQGSSAPLG